MKLTFIIQGKEHVIEVDPNDTLLTCVLNLELKDGLINNNLKII